MDSITVLSFGVISVAANFLFIFSTIPTALHSELINFNFQFSAIAKNVAIKQPFMAALKDVGVTKCLSSHSKIGGVAVSI